jgi:D-lactate dehydrogenase
MAKIAFFDLEGWEREILRQRFEPLGHKLILESGPLRLDGSVELSDVDVLSVFVHSRVGRRELEAMPDLKAIVTRSAGYDHIDLEACRERGVAVYNVPEYGSETVAEYTVMLILMLLRRVKELGLQPGSKYPRSSEVRGWELAGKTVGVVGAGRIGSRVAKLVHAFGARVLAYDVYVNEELVKGYGVRYVDLDTLLSQSDVVTLHAPLTPATKHIINRGNIRKMKRGAILVNTSRGGLVETEALIEALEEGHLAGAALDVVEGEWALMDGAASRVGSAKAEEVREGLLAYLVSRYPNVIVTPHVAWNTWEAVERIWETTISTIDEILKGGSPRNRVA